MLKPAKGEMSIGLIIGLVLIVAIIIGLIVWSRSNKTADMAQESESVMINGETQSATTTTTGTTTDGMPTTTTTTSTVLVEDNPTLPQTGMGPDAK